MVGPAVSFCGLILAIGALKWMAEIERISQKARKVQGVALASIHSISFHSILSITLPSTPPPSKLPFLHPFTNSSWIYHPYTHTIHLSVWRGRSIEGESQGGASEDVAASGGASRGKGEGIRSSETSTIEISLNFSLLAFIQHHVQGLFVFVLNIDVCLDIVFQSYQCELDFTLLMLGLS